MTVDDELLTHADGAMLESRRLARELRKAMLQVEQTWAHLREAHAWAKRGWIPRDEPC